MPYLVIREKENKRYNQKNNNNIWNKKLSTKTKSLHMPILKGYIILAKKLVEMWITYVA